MNLKFWDKKARMIAALAKLTDDEAREVVKEAKPGLHLHVNPKGRKKKEVESNAE
jgi:hypothetical protein